MLITNKFYIQIGIFLFFLNTFAGAQESVQLAEGKVSIFRYDFRNLRSNFVLASFVSMESKNVVKLFKNETYLFAYVSDQKLEEFQSRFKKGVLALLIENERPEYQTIWDLIDIELQMIENNMYSSGEIRNLDSDIQDQLLYDAFDLLIYGKNSVINNFNPTFHQSDSSISGLTSFGFSLELAEEKKKESFTTPITPQDPQSSFTVDPSSSSNEESGLQASFTYSESGVFQFTFDASSSTRGSNSTITDYSWDFGDSSTGSGMTITHTYDSEDSFIVTLTITDNHGNTSSIKETVGFGFYVDPVNGNDSNNGSFSSPWRTIHYANSQMDGVTATTIHLLNGMYSSSTNSEIYPIGLKDRVTLDGESNSVIIDGGGAPLLFTMDTLTSLTIDTVTIQNAGIGIEIDGSSGIQIQNSRFQNIVNGGIGYGIHTSDSTVVVDTCFFQDNDTGFYGGDDPGNSSNVSIMNSSFSNHNHHIRYSARFGIPSMFSLVNCVFTNIGQISFYYINSLAINQCDFSGEPPNIPTTYYLRVGYTNATIKNSVFHDMSGPMWTAIWDIDPGDLNIYNCTFDSITTTNGTIVSIVGNNNPTNIINSSFTNNPTSRCIRTTGSTNPGNLIYENNLFFNNVMIFEDDADGDPAVPGVPTTNNNLFVAPNYVGSGAHPYLPNTGSQLIDNGQDLSGTVDADYKNNPRPFNGIFDIGAYEVEGGADPIVKGRIYQSETGELVNDAYIGIYKEGTTTPIDTQKGSSFLFNVLPGNYFLAVKKSGYHFPSVKASGASKGIHFSVIDGIDQTIDIPLDSYPWLELQKNANKKDVEIGEIVTIHCKITNPYLFSDIHQISLIDTFPPGFQYIQRSTRLNGIPYDDPENGSFYLGSIVKRQTLNLTYQLMVSPHASYGDNLSTAVCIKNALKDPHETSDRKSIVFNLIPDELFYMGTVIGKIKSDVGASLACPQIELITEYGLKIKPDKYGRFHIPNVMPGRHVLKVITKGYVGKPVLFDVREGTITDVEVEIEKIFTSENMEGMEQDPESESGIVNEEPSFFITALGEIGLTDTNIDGTDIDGRGAIYAEGDFHHYHIQGSIDTQRLENEYKLYNKNKLRSTSHIEKDFPLFGDDSKIDASNNDTRDLIQFKIEKDRSYLKWGTIDIDYPYYRKIFNGGELKLEYQGADPQLSNDISNLNFFYAKSDHKTAYEELNGYNGSVYYLKNNDIIQGSEKVTLVIREPVTLRTIETVSLNKGDYTFFYESGKVILNKPIPTFLNSHSRQILNTNINAGDLVLLNVVYEYEDLASFEKDAWGGRVSKSLGKHIITSVQYSEEHRAEDPYSLSLGEITLKKDFDNWVKFQYGKSSEGFSDFNTSYDGGMNFNSIQEDQSIGKSGDLIGVEGQLKYLNSFTLKTFYSKTDAGFSSLGAPLTTGLEKQYIEVFYHPFKFWNFGVSGFVQHQGEEKLTLTKFVSSYSVNHFDFDLEYQIQHLKNSLHSLWKTGGISPISDELLGLKIGYELWGKSYIFGGTQFTIKGFDNDQAYGGMNLNLFNDLFLQLEGRFGTIGESYQFSLFDQNSSVALVNNQSLGSKNNSLHFSKSYDINPKSRVTFDSSVQSSLEKTMVSDSIHHEYVYNQNLFYGLSYEKGYLKQEHIKNPIFRESFSSWYTYKSYPFEHSGKFECRIDEISDNIQNRVYYLEESLKLQLQPGFSFSFSGGGGYAKNPETDKKRIDFTNLVVGFAYRSRYHSRFNMIGKYIYLTDLLSDHKALDFIEDNRTKKHVFQTGLHYQLLPSLQLSQSFAHKIFHDKTGNRSWLKSKTYLSISGIKMDLYKKIQWNLEYRLLKNQTLKDQKTGYFTELLYPLNQNIYFSVGYNFTNIEDSLIRENDEDSKGPLIRITGIY